MEKQLFYISGMTCFGCERTIERVVSQLEGRTIIVAEESLNGCNNEIYLPAFDQQVRLEARTATISFTPEEPGIYPYTCWMGMLQNIITVIEE